MKTMRPWPYLLSFFLLNCAGTPQDPGVDSTPNRAAGGSNAGQLQQVQDWPNPGQERWVEEPVFQGRVHLVESGEENPQTIILIHGLGDKGVLDWLRVFPELTDDYHVIAVDLPGFGSSDSHQAQYAPGKYARLVSWVAGQYAHGPVIVIGHSMGGAVSLRYAHDYPQQVARLVMIDVAGVLQRTVFVKHLAKVPDSYDWLEPYQAAIPGLDRLFKGFARKADSLTQSLLVTADRMADLPAMMMSNGLAQKYLYKDRDSMNAALGLVYEDFSLATREVNVPTHIIWGESDSVAPVRTGVVLANVMSDAQLHVIPGAGHVPMKDSFDEFMSVLQHSLENEPIAKQAHKRLVVVSEQPAREEETRCSGMNDSEYTGHHKVIRLSSCRGVVLRDLVAESIELRSSEVTMENVSLKGSGTGLLARNSVINATLLHVDAGTGMEIASSYLDLAGADFDVRKELVEIRGGAQLYFSLSQSRLGGMTTSLHGMSLGDEFVLK